MNKKVSEAYALEARFEDLAEVSILLPLAVEYLLPTRLLLCQVTEQHLSLETGESVESSDNAGGASMGFNSWIDWSGYRGKESRDDVCLP